MQLVLQLTRDCNLACRYCFQRHRAGPGMSAETAEAALRWALGRGTPHVALTWFGGEPLLERATIEALTPRLASIGREYGGLVTAKVSTNGQGLDAEFCRFARENTLFVSLSTDGAPSVQDAGRPRVDGGPSSKAVERALDALVATGTPFATYQVITPANVRALAASVDWLFEHGSRVLVSTLDFGADWSQQNLDALAAGYRALARRYARWTRWGIDFHLAPFDSKIAARTRRREHRAGSCSAGVRQFAVDPEGYIYPCIEFLESPRFRVGHVERGLERDAWKAFFAEEGDERPEECGDCAIRARCGSSCACLNHRLGGATRAVDALLCAHERLVTLAADRIGARLWQRRERAFLRRQYDPHHHVLSTLESLLEEGWKR